jgi:2'-5' RNA ligase
MRLFFCLELAEEVRKALAEVSRLCRGALGNGSWVPLENFHLTVRFLGEVPEDRLPELLEVGRKAAAEAKPFTLTFEVLGGFPQPKAARVLWIGPKEEPLEFQKLCQTVEEAVQSLGFPEEKKEPVPHVTLARFKGPKDLRPVLARSFPPVPAAKIEALTLMKSELRPEGAKYTPLYVWKFGG